MDHSAEGACEPMRAEWQLPLPRLPEAMLRPLGGACCGPPPCAAEHTPCSDSARCEGTPTDSTRSGDSFREIRVCRFCLDSEDFDMDSVCSGCVEDAANDFVQPCPCRGSLKYVHLSCLVQHFEAQGSWHNFRCPTCKQPYEGRALRELAQISRARVLQLHGPTSPHMAHSLCYLAQAHAQLGDARKSKELLEEGLAVSEGHFGEGHVATTAALAELASAHGKMGDVQKQRELLERCLQIKEQHFGLDHINTAVTLNNLATAHSELGNVEEERAMLERSLEIKEKHYGKGHVATTAALVNLAGVYSGLGDISRGLQLLEVSLDIEERHFGVGHVETAITLNNLALAHGEGGDIPKMQELLLRSLRIKEGHFGAEHQELCLTLANLGLACAAAGELVGARDYCERAVCVCCGPESAWSRRRGVVLLRAASVYFALGDDTLAADVADRSLAALERAVGRRACDHVLGLESARMARIWASVRRPEVAQRLQEFRAAAAASHQWAADMQVCSV